MVDYEQYCPIAKASQVLGDRWTLLIVRELLGGATGFNELQRGLPGISRSVLADRLKMLERMEVVARSTGANGRTTGYELTPAGRDLKPVVRALGEWGATWALGEPREQELDPDLVVLWMARHVDRSALPPERTVLQFDWRGPKGRQWMVLTPAEVSVCLQHPGFDVDLRVSADTASAYRVYLGLTELGAALAAGSMAFDGPLELQRGFARWFTLSSFREATRDAAARRVRAGQLPEHPRVALVS